MKRKQKNKKKQDNALESLNHTEEGKGKGIKSNFIHTYEAFDLFDDVAKKVRFLGFRAEGEKR